jgi:predicted Zn-dependent protease
MNSQRHATVSLSMIVRNEAHQLADCLAPIADLFDEIVIVDTGSQDKTCHVARQFTNNLYHFAWRDDFAAARNQSLRHATGEWVFWLDADDRISLEDRAKLAALVSQLDRQNAVFFMDTFCRASDPMDIERVVTHPRLFRRSADIHWRRRVHEQLGPWPAGFELMHSAVQIEHLGYCAPALLQRKRQRNLRLLRMDFAIHPNDPELLLELAAIHTRLGQLSEARRWFNGLLETAPRSFLETPHTLASLAELAAQEGNFRQLVDAAARGIALFPQDDYFPYLRAEGLYQLGDYAAARMALTTLLTSPPPPPQFRMGSPRHIRERLAPLGLGEVLRVEKRLQEAEAVLLHLTHAFPDDPVAWEYLGRVYIDGHEPRKLRQVIERAANCPCGRFFASLLTARWNLAHGEPASARQIIDDLLTESPQMPLLLFLRAECLAQANAPRQEQRQAYRDVLRIKPGQPRALNMIQRLERRSESIQQTQALSHSVIAGQGVPNGVYVAS